MSPSLLVFGPGDVAWLPLLRALGRRGFRLHLVPPTLVPPARAAGLDAHDACVLLDDAARARLAGARARFARNLAALEPGLWRRFTVREVSLWDRMRAPFRAALVETAERAAVMTALLEALAVDGTLAGVVLGYDMVPAGRAAVQVARRLGVPTVHVPHAVLARPRVPMAWQGAGVFADRVCAPGDFSRAGYLGAGADPDAVVVTGSPRWDGYAGVDEAERRARRATVACALRLDPAAPIVLFAPSWIERSTANASQHVQAALAVYQGVLAAVRTHAVGGAQLVVKLHPGEWARPGLRPETLVEGYVGVARRAGVTRIAVTAGYGPELVAAADVVVTVNSNLGLEALLCGRPVVNVPLLAEEADALFTPDAGVLALRTPAETAAAVSAVLADPALRARLAAAGAEAVHRYVHAPDGCASERVAAVVAEVVHAARAAGGRQPVRAAAPPPAASAGGAGGTKLARGGLADRAEGVG